jgi:hypothetical protein
MNKILEDFEANKAHIEPVIKKLLEDDKWTLACKVMFCYVQTYRLLYLKEKHNSRVKKHKIRQQKVFDEVNLYYFDTLINEDNFR